MIGKVMKRGAFKGCVEYAFSKEQAKLLDAKDVLLDSIESIIQSFHTQSLMRPHIKQPAGHTALSYSVDDKDRLTDKAMVILERE